MAEKKNGSPKATTKKTQETARAYSVSTRDLLSKRTGKATATLERTLGHAKSRGVSDTKVLEAAVRASIKADEWAKTIGE